MVLTKALHKVKQYGTLVMFQHTIFSLSFGLVSMILASKLTENSFLPPWKIGLIFLSLLSARTGANAINRVIDAEIDAKNPRTASRQLPQGVLSKKEVILFSCFCFVLMVLSAFFINPLCALLSPGALIFLVAYSYTKRFTFLCHLFLGVTCAIAPMGAWIAVTGDLGDFTPAFVALVDLLKSVLFGNFAQVGQLFQYTIHLFISGLSMENSIFIPIFLSVINACWVAGFDIIYGSQDVEFDRANGIHSIPAKFGLENGLYISSFLHFVAILFLYFVGFLTVTFGWIYFTGILIITVLLIIEHLIVKPTNLTHAKIASYNINEIVSVVFIFFPIVDIYL
ncbi:4-hydroxybenzoate polyprenyltransferase, mitochondrial [Bacillus sp. T2.9-1]|uniref:4-hydroxybenzoate octaprenyltransferase n=1 Tax=Bacillus sp. T2.9-1 TaxID=3041163 RepID=UPI002477AF8A|nr:4-hydroxybenzoate octaprenyltransferase [Bacillus sp. T2.9-1]CAI9393237.1 4-hydroxybenzoate polyprenyltransferase, mitochondrial [Bacillus sp. T2.9-1]